MRNHHVAAILLFLGTLVPALIMQRRAQLPSGLGRYPELLVLGVLGCLVVAMANGANDIANSVGTSYGAGALSLRQAITLGAAAEFSGAMSLGSFVAKTISKGVIEPATFAADGCQGSLEYGLGMLCVLAGTGSTTLLATLYGLPISASHGVIGGLVAVGIFTHGAASLGQAPLVATVVAWVASPLLGGLTAALLHAVVRSTVHETVDPAVSADRLQPPFVALTTAVAAAVLVVSGPKAIRVQPQSLAVAASCAIGLLAALAVLVRRRLCPPSTASITHQRHIDEHEMHELSSAGRLPPPARAVTADAEEGVALCCAPCVVSSVEEEPEGGAVAAKGGESGGGGSAGGMEGAGAPGGAEPSSPAEERPFVPLLVLSALTVSFAHGANDLGNSIGPLAAILVVEQPGGDITREPVIPLWLLALGSCGFVFGIFLLGSRTIKTVGGKITKLTPSRSFAVQLGTAVAVLSSTVLGLAVSTSHCLVGAIIGVGLCDRLRGSVDGELNGAMILKIIIGWAVTIPLAMLVTVLAYAALLPAYEPDPVCNGAPP